jgi:hypothetical protein
MPAAHDPKIISKIKSLMDSGMTNPEIARAIGKTKASVAIITARVLGGNPNYMKKKRKHQHLHGDVLAFRLGHTDKETMEHFELTAGELKSCLTCAYRNPKFKNLRKDTRRHDAWTSGELLMMLRYAGILRRSKIATLIKRDGERVIKEKMASLKVATRNVNGANISQFRRLFGQEPLYRINGQAGPGSTKTNRFVIVPWFHMAEMYRAVPHNKSTLKAFECYAMFAEFVWKGHPWKMMKKDKNVAKFLIENGGKK